MARPFVKKTMVSKEPRRRGDPGYLKLAGSSYPEARES
jgi:hypothetical protein